MTEHGEDDDVCAFESSRSCFESVLAFTEGDEATGLDHGELEARLQVKGRELL